MTQTKEIIIDQKEGQRETNAISLWISTSLCIVYRRNTEETVMFEDKSFALICLLEKVICVFF